MRSRPLISWKKTKLNSISSSVIKIQRYTRNPTKNAIHSKKAEFDEPTFMPPTMRRTLARAYQGRKLYRDMNSFFLKCNICLNFVTIQTYIWIHSSLNVTFPFASFGKHAISQMCFDHLPDGSDILQHCGHVVQSLMKAVHLYKYKYKYCPLDNVAEGSEKP